MPFTTLPVHTSLLLLRLLYRCACCFTLGAAAVILAPSQSNAQISRVWQHNGTTTTQNLGHTLAVIDDTSLDTDADKEVVVASSNSGIGGFVQVRSSDSGVVLSTLSGKWSDDSFGSLVSNIGDVTGDDKPDFAVNVASIPGSAAADHRKLYYRLYSGSNLSLYREVVFATYTGSVDQGCFAVEGVGDINSDGYDDIGCPDRFTGGSPINSGSGKLTILSGYNGSTIRTITNGDPSISGFNGVTSLGDINQDGIPDLAVRFNRYSSSGQLRYGIRFFSGSDGTVLALPDRMNVPEDSLALPDVVALGDVSGDTVPDFVIVMQSTSPGPYRGQINFYSGTTGAPIRQTLLTFTGNSSLLCSPSGDVNADSTPDLVCSTADGGLMTARVFSGLDGKSLAVLNSSYSSVPTAIRALDDVTEDGKIDFVLGASGDPVGSNSNGTVYVYGYHQFTVPDPAPPSFGLGDYYKIGQRVVFF